MHILAIQQALLTNGYDLGPRGADGIWGRASIAALRKFQSDDLMKVTGVPDEPTLERLFGKRTVSLPAVAVWYAEAMRLKGLRETPGVASNPTIMGWAGAIGGWVAHAFTADATPWCGLFAAHCIGATLPEEKLPANPLSALAWKGFGIPLARSLPAIGAICVFSRKGGGHVGFYGGEDRDTIHVLGGNQSDAVTIARVPASRLVAIRWPATAPIGKTGVVSAAATGPLSRNEA